jgi:hypothetical protein
MYTKSVRSFTGFFALRNAVKMLDEPVKVPIIRIYSGDTTDFRGYRFKDGTGAVINLAQWTFTAVWRRTPQTPAFLVLTVDDSEAAVGLVRVSASATITAQIKARGVWDLQATFNGVVKTLVYGSTENISDVTR